MSTKFGNVLSVNIEKPVTAGSLCVGRCGKGEPGEAARRQCAASGPIWAENSFWYSTLPLVQKLISKLLSDGSFLLVA